MSDDTPQGGVWHDPWYTERYGDPTVRPSMTTGSASVLPMTEEEMAAAAERAKVRVVGFAPPEEE